MKDDCTSVVLDTSLAETKGHYFQLSIDVCESFERTQRSMIFITSNVCLKDWYEKFNPRYIEIRYQPDAVEALNQVVLGLIAVRKNLVHVIILRGKDVTQEEIMGFLPWSLSSSLSDVRVLLNVSGIISESKEKSNESVVIQRYKALGDKLIILAWDTRVAMNNFSNQTQFLPEPKIKVPREVSRKKRSIGFYGRLSQERGLFDLLMSVFFNPKLSYRIIGYTLDRKYIFRMRNFVSFRTTPFRGIFSLAVNYLIQLAFLFKRVIVEEKYFESENDMIKDLQQCSAVFFSCNRSPYSSGLVYQSLAAGVPVIWIDGNSAMASVLSNKFPSGKIQQRSLFSWNKLTHLVDLVQGNQTSPVFSYSDFDAVLCKCSCEN